MTETSTDSERLPLAGLRVLDLCDGKGETCGRYLADLGADVVLVEPPGGAVTRTRQPVIANTSLYFATHNANKRSVELDLADADDRERFLELLAVADIIKKPLLAGLLAILFEAIGQRSLFHQQMQSQGGGVERIKTQIVN